MAIWVAVGGRGTLVGAVLGALIVNAAKSWFTAAFPELWLFVLGSLFIAVTLFLPRGVIGLFGSGSPAAKLGLWIPRWHASRPSVKTVRQEP
jgi:ABC-type branched-subunit amino acid transport system permease subunit